MADVPQPTDDLTAIDVWAELAKREIDRFVDNWKREAREDPEMHPERLPLGEWDEQFRWVAGG